MACGDYHTLCLLEDGKVYAWGGTLYKKVVNTSANTGQNNEPRLVTGLANITSIDCGDFHSVALDRDGCLFTWGGGGAAYNKGQCGHGHNEDVEHPVRVEGLPGAVVKVAAGGFHTVALTRTNELYAWGSGTYGECGIGEFVSTNKPRKVKMPVEEQEDEFEERVVEVVQVSAGGHHSMVLTAAGKVYAFGYGSHGQLGLRTTKNYCSPQLVKDLSSKPIVTVSAGWNHSLALASSGDLYACGYGNHGQLGQGDKEARTGFVHVAALGGKNVWKVFAGGNHSFLVLDEDIPVHKMYRPPSPVG